MLGNPVDEWAHKQGLRFVFIETDVANLLATGRAAAILDRIHGSKSQDLGNVVAFTEMYLGRAIRAEERRFETLCVTDFGLHPYSLLHLIEFVDGLYRIGDERLRSDRQFADIDAYTNSKVFPAAGIPFGEFFGTRSRSFAGHSSRDASIDWSKADYLRFPVSRYAAWCEALKSAPIHDRNDRSVYARAVLLRELEGADFEDGRWVPKEWHLHPDRYGDLCRFVQERIRLGEIVAPPRWPEQFPEIRKSIEGSSL